MRLFLILWLGPLAFFWGWYFLSYNDMHFGYLFLSRLLHDRVFEVYGSILHMDPVNVAPMLAKACIVDSMILLGIIAFRKRKQIKAWWAARQETSEVVPASPDFDASRTA
jgi:hypothetical protein